MSKTTLAIILAAQAAMLGYLGYLTHKHNQEIGVIEHYIQAQQEIICLNANALPIQYNEHKEACYGVVGSVMLRHQ